MAILTNQGLVIRRYPEIVKLIEDALVQNINSEMDFSEDTLVSKMIAIMANEMSVMEAMLLQLRDSMDRDKAEGSSLDDLLYLIGVERQRPARSSGFVEFIGAEGSNIPIRTILINPSNNDRFLTSEAGIISRNNCRAAWIKPTVNDSTLYSLGVMNNTYTFTSGAAATADEIIDGLVSAINSANSPIYEAEKVLVGSDQTILIKAKTREQNIRVSFVQDFSMVQIKVSVPTQAEQFGAISAPTGTVTVLLSGVSGIYDVFNERDFGVGRLRETDAEFKARASRSLSLSGSSTYSAIYTALSNLQGVSNLVLLENSTKATDSDGVPASAFEAIVDIPAGDDNDKLVANTLWQEKPIGIESHGNYPVTITDDNNQPRVIKFSRPQPIYIAMKVEFKKYTEEVEPVNIDSVIKDAIVDYSRILTTGVDLIPSRFIGSVYTSADSGIGEVVVYAQKIATESTTPNPSLWSTDRIDISPREYAVVLRDKITVEDIT